MCQLKAGKQKGLLMKREAVINDELFISWTSNFQQMSEEEIRKIYISDTSSVFALSDKERHNIITVLCKSYNPLAIKLTSPKKMVKTNEKLTRSLYRDYHYVFGYFFTHFVAGSTVGGYCFTYSVDNIKQAVKTVLLRSKRNIYSISCYGRIENCEDDHKRFDTILKSVRWK